MSTNTVLSTEARSVGRSKVRGWLSARTLGYLLAAALLAGYIFWPQVQALAWLNFAQVQRFSGDNASAQGQAAVAFARALALDPANPQIRWQAGEALADSGDAAGAYSTLQPLEKGQPLDKSLARLMLATYFAAGHSGEALQLYRGLSDQPSLPPGIAARLANSFLQSNIAMPPSTTGSLLAQSLGLDPTQPEYKAYEGEFTTSGFWATPFGKALQQALSWRSRPVPAVSNVAAGDNAPAQAEQSSVARLLSGDPSAVQLGPELATNGGFEQHSLVNDNPVGWQPIYNSNGGEWDLASFIMGGTGQAFRGSQALRIDGVDIRHLPDKEAARAGFQHGPITLEPGAPYAISFVYSTQNTEESQTALWLTFDPQVIYALDKRFPPTHGQWQRVTIVGWNRTAKAASIAPLLRLWSTGTALFDDFSVRPILSPLQAQPQSALVNIESASK